MSKLIASTLAVVLCFTAVFAQEVKHSSDNVEVIFNEQTTRSEGEAVVQFVAEFEDGFLVFRRNRESFGFEHRNLEGVLVRKNEVSVPKDKLKVTHIHDFIQSKNRVYALFATTEKKEKRNVLYLQELDLSTLTLKDKPRELARIEGAGFYGNFGKAFPQSSVSPDGSHIMIAFKEPASDDKKKTDNYWFAVYDDELDQIWKTSINLAMGDGELHVGGMNHGGMIDRSVMAMKTIVPGGMDAFEVDNKGRVSAWAEYWGPDMKKARRDDLQEVKLFFLRVSGEGLTVKDFPLPGGEDKAYDIKTFGIFYKETGDVVVTGYYINNHDYRATTKEHSRASQGTDGVFYMVYSLDSESIIDEQFHEFPANFMFKYQWGRAMKKVSRDAANGLDVGIPDLKLRITRQLEDGSILLMGEMYYAEAYQDMKGRTRYTYHSINIYVTYLNADGSLAWNKLIPKYQERDAGPAGHGFVEAVNGNKLYLFYNDAFENLKPDWDQKVIKEFDVPPNPVALATLDLKNPDAIQREQAWEAEWLDKRMFMMHTMGKQISADTYMLYVNGGRGLERFVKLKLK